SLANKYFDESRKIAAELEFDINIPAAFGTGSFEPQLVQLGAKAFVPSYSNDFITLSKCSLPWQACSINELGVVHPDAVYWRSAGDLTKSSFESIWNGRKYRALRRRVNRRPDQICTSCRMPSFDGDSNLSALQSRPGRREMLQAALNFRRTTYQF